MGWLELDDLGRDLRHTLRGLRRSPGFAATVTLILALGIGANTAMFSIVNGILLRPLPYPDAGEIVTIGESSSLMGSVSGMFLSRSSMLLLQENAESFEQLAAYRGLRRERDGVTLRGARVSPSMFPLFRVSPHLGRLFLEEEARTGAPRVVLLSHRAWTNHFASDPDIVGTFVDLGPNVHLVVGVLAEGFHFPTPDSEFWLPYVIEPSATESTSGQPAGITLRTVTEITLPRAKRLKRWKTGCAQVQMAVGGDGSTVVQGRVEHRRGQLHGGTSSLLLGDLLPPFGPVGGHALRYRLPLRG